MSTPIEPNDDAIPAKPTRVGASWLGVVFIGLLAALLLSGISRLTAEKIDHNRQAQTQQTLRALLGDVALPRSLAWSERRLQVCAQRTVTRATAKGYGGPIALLLAWVPKPDGQPGLNNVAVTSHAETPGIGDFFQQRETWFEPLFEVTSEGAERPTQAPDAISGATITRRALLNAITLASRQITQHESKPRFFTNTPCNNQ